LKKILSLLGIALLTTANSAFAIPSLSFIIIGDTFSTPYSITNQSTGGEKVTRFQLDLSTIPVGSNGALCFDTVGGGLCNTSAGTPFSAVGSTGVTTGLTSPATVADGATLLDMQFSGFDAGETFSWNIDIDTVLQPTVYGNDLVGASAFVDFSDGERLLGTLQAVAGSPQASRFTVTGTTRVQTVPEPGTLALVAIGVVGVLRSARQRRA
jgi:hypothetical protein